MTDEVGRDGPLDELADGGSERWGSEPDDSDGGGASDSEGSEGGNADGHERATTPDGAVVGPTPEYAPEDVVALLAAAIESGPGGAGTDRAERRRRALQGGDGPYRTAFTLASPRFRSDHGDVVAFAAAMAGPITRPLFDAATVERGPLELADDHAIVTVLARPGAEDDVEEPRTYDLTLHHQSAGKYEGCWMLDAIDLVYVGESPRFRRMPRVRFAGKAVRCEDGDTLRDVLLDAEGRTPHNDAAQIANCGGNGLCGTCAVGVEGETDEPGRRERSRLSMPPFDGEDELRLSCQTCVRGDLEVRKHDGLWGQHVSELEDEPDDEGLSGEESSPGDGADETASGRDPDEEPIEVTTAEFGGSYEYDPTALVDGTDDGSVGANGGRSQ